jgi:hypothetical protein
MEHIDKQQPRPNLISQLMEGPLDIVGDVHGEIDALRDLFGVLGYDAKGRHPAGRRLVFVGDICDRGPDSIAVMELVGELMDRQLAQCVLGNHELNLLLVSRKEGNGWYFDEDHDRQEGKFATSRQADTLSRAWIADFIASLPIALNGPSLRVVHACWNNDAIRSVASATEQSVPELYSQFEHLSTEAMRQDGTLARAAQEQRQHRDALHDPGAAMVFLPALARKNQAHQMANPVRILTSGVERQTSTPFFSSGKWRMVERVAWWDEYQDETPVVIGHYWRWPVPVDRQIFGKAGTDLFAGTTVEQGLGPRGNVYCVDYSVGRRFQERLRGGPFLTRLAALRWPERSIAFDDGSIVSTC